MGSLKFISFAIVLVLVLATSWACSEPLGGARDPTIPDYVAKADAVVIGKVTDLVPDPRFNYAVPQPPPVEGEEPVAEVKPKAFVALVNVSCAFKGKKTIPISVNITSVGEIPGMCITTKLDVGKEYIFALSELDGVFRLWHDKIEKTPENMAKLTKQCGLFSMQPLNTPEGEKQECPAVSDPDNCEAYVPPPPIEEPEIKPENNKPLGKDDEEMSDDPPPKSDDEKTNSEKSAGQIDTPTGGAPTLKAALLYVPIILSLEMLRHFL